MNLTIVEGKKRKPRKWPSRAKKPRKKKEKTISALVKELDALVSRFVRLSAADQNGICTCYTCGHKVHYKNIHAGHYVSRFYKATRWDLRNVKPQCMMDNLWKRGDPVVFRENLVRDYGEAVVKELEASRHISRKMEREYLLSEIAHYTYLLSQIPIPN